MIAALAFLVAVVAGPCWPPPVAAPVSQPFRAPDCRWCPGHLALGFVVAPGTTVTAVAPGLTVFAGKVAGVGYATVALTDGRRTTYGGLRRLSVRAGQTVARGQQVGDAGGAVTFSVRVGDVYVDPGPLLAHWRVHPRLVPVDGSRARSPAGPRSECPAGTPSR